MIVNDWRAVGMALAGEPVPLVYWALKNFRDVDIIAAKQLADECDCDFEDVLLMTQVS